MLLKYTPNIMEAFETTLTGSDGSIDGIVTHISNEAYQFTSLDNALHLTIAKNTKGKWVRLSGSEPYFVGWVDELSEKILSQPKETSTTAAKKSAVKKPGTIKVKAKPLATASTVAKTKTASSVKKEAAEPQKSKKSAKVATTQKRKVSSAASKK